MRNFLDEYRDVQIDDESEEFEEEFDFFDDLLEDDDIKQEESITFSTFDHASCIDEDDIEPDFYEDLDDEKEDIYF